MSVFNNRFDLVRKLSFEKQQYMVSFVQMDYLLTRRALRKALVEEGVVSFDKLPSGVRIMRVKGAWVVTLCGAESASLVRTVFDTVIALTTD